MIIKRAIKNFTFICILVLLPLSAQAAPSYSCSGKLTSNERLICKNKELARLDQMIADTFHELTAILNRGAADFVRSDQLTFVRQRQKCRHKFRCSRNIMRTRLNHLTSELEQQRRFRSGELSDEESDDNPCGPGFTMVEGKCIHNSDLEQQNKIGDTRPLPTGKYGIYVLSHEDSLRLDATADKLLFTHNKAGNKNAPKQPFYLVFVNGAYIVTDLKSGLVLHADGGGDRQVSVRYQPNDDFTRFRLTPALDGCFYIQTVATGNYWVWEPNSQVIVVRPQPAGEESMFCFMPQ